MEAPSGAKQSKMPKVAKVKNKTPAEIQITAEQLLREAKERDLEIVPPPPKQKISDPEELAAYKLRKRKAFEDAIRRNRSLVSNWIKYAQWEESQHEIQRARSVFERGLDVDHRNITLWLKYAELEMKNKQVNHTRNIWDRAITILPRANQFWYKYTYMEEMLGNVAGARQVFERWMEWEPEEQAWQTYIKFELRYKEFDRTRAVFERFVIVHPEVKNWIKYARFEEQNSYVSSARRIYERGVEYFGEDNMDEKLFLSFSKFEENQKEHERARVIYKYALDHIDKERAQELYKAYTIHEKKFGDRSAIEDVILSKRRYQYEEEVRSNEHNYDAWFDYLRLVENEGSVDAIRELYERAIANVPPTAEKRHWRRYIYLWINYALFEELVADDGEKTRQVYKACLDLIPHKRFTFAKMWLLFAQFEIRQKELQTARKILGMAIGRCPKDKLFRGYIDLEIQLREFERCRILYEKFLETGPENCTTWIKFAELETILGDQERARAIYELAISQPRLDMPEVLWKSYIDFEIEADEYARTRALYRRLLERTQHVKVWISFAQFELSVNPDDVSFCRGVYAEANKAMKSSDEKEERLMLLESWREFEVEHGDEKTKADVENMMPKRVKKRRKVQTEDGSDAGWEEYFDYIFPSDEAAMPNLKLLAMAKAWRKKQEEQASNDIPTQAADADPEEGEGETINEGDGEETVKESYEETIKEGDGEETVKEGGGEETIKEGGGETVQEEDEEAVKEGGGEEAVKEEDEVAVKEPEKVVDA